jgi:hypothetical protein
MPAFMQEFLVYVYYFLKFFILLIYDQADVGSSSYNG